MENYRIRRRQRRIAPWVLAGLVGIIGVQVVVLSMMKPTHPVARRPRPRFIPPAVIPRVSPHSPPGSPGTRAVSTPSGSEAGYRVVRDDRLLYVPAHDADPDPIELDLLPPGPAMILSVRLADLHQSPSGQLTLEAFAPDLADLMGRLIHRIAVPAASITRLTVALHPAGLGRFDDEIPSRGGLISRFGASARNLPFRPVEVSPSLYPPIGRVGLSGPGRAYDQSRVGGTLPGRYRVRPSPREGDVDRAGAVRLDASFSVTLADPMPLDEMLQKWQVSEVRTDEGATIYASDDDPRRAYYLLPDQVESQSIRRFATGTVEQMSELASIEGDPISLPRALRSLWDATDRQADLCVISSPNFLFADGRSLLIQNAPEVMGPLRRFLVPSTSAWLVIADFGPQQVYCEVRLSAAGSVTPDAMSRKMSESIKSWPVWADEFLRSRHLDSTWRPLAKRWPSMIRWVADQFRVGISDQTAVANAYLPSIAVPQVSLGTLLAFNTPSGTSNTASEPMQEALTIDQILDRPMTVSFIQESLEFATDAITDSLTRQLPQGTAGPEIKIMGGDLQLSGITQNQQIRNFKKEDLPLRTVLTDLVRSANPDKSATGPTDPKQSLIWVVATGDDAKPMILVTTRQAAAKESNQYKLPPEFVVSSNP